MAEFDKKGRLLSQKQLAAIFAKANKSGISDNQLNKKVLTSLNDEIIAARTQKQSDPIGMGINSIIAKKLVIAKPKKIKDVIESVAKTNGISKEEAKRNLESSNVIPIGISDEAVIGATKEAQFNEIKQGLDQQKIKKIEREIITKEIAKQRHGTVASLPSGLQINRKQLQELRKKLQGQQEQEKILVERAKIRDKIIAKQDKFVKILESDLQKSKEEPGQKISRAALASISERALQGKAIGVDPLTVAIQEGRDKQFQLQKKAFELRQLGFSPRLAEERAKIILNQ